MKTILFTLQTDAGEFWIRPESTGHVRLGLGRQQLRSYASPTNAARAVAERSTRSPEWDERSTVPAPASLTKWRRVASAPAARRRRAARQTGDIRLSD